MKLYKANDSWIVTTENQSLWFNRRSLSLYSKEEPVNDDFLSSSAWDASFVSDIYGYIGQVEFFKDGLRWLLFTKSQQLVCQMGGGEEIYRITDLLIQPFDNFDEEADSKTNGTTTHKSELKCVEELRVWYQETQCFYYSSSYDLTNSLQRSYGIDKNIPLWMRADERFFWNRPMLGNVIDKVERERELGRWIQPIIMGYVENCRFENDLCVNIQLVVISRRDRHRSGVRIHCRGVDDDGHVANYVETEQILLADNNIMSFVMIRGSIPIYWSQPGIKYRPPPKLDRSEFIVRHN